MLRDSKTCFVGPSVPPSVHPSVRLSHFTFSALMGVLALLLLPICSTDLNHGPCPPARDWGSRVSCLVLSKLKMYLKYYLHYISLYLNAKKFKDVPAFTGSDRLKRAYLYSPKKLTAPDWQTDRLGKKRNLVDVFCFLRLIHRRTLTLRVDCLFQRLFFCLF